ncbi:FolC bifunctional protein [Desulfofarcimen acetoxidans DSM 771]|uniref:Dihydrofolate synthase/folylpolyglutamate synthase n=1 Tax=Desulfofarcimen acetoxidans (strain ATCC 49208 / DSM 771 / KCTC 5769 / VKM B-1644 / 5575) TaxID=485916 RepID=C8W5S6_DESAS|nr:folylpolyglutamate synthase/dihydrofolate synthase family protein [Desulfofarcimen acetoxidans]ACV64076.1 FolC bifunctional protein [Desulfofarcimen acetoxidans DSM 771]
MEYKEAMNYLENLTKFGFNFGLGRIEELLRRLGNPHTKIKAIHIGGTNGKGSTTAMLSAVLKEAGLRVGMFTSPHLHSYTERYRINGEPVGQERIAKMITRLRPHLEDMVREGFEHPTEFEAGTAMAFLYFAEEKVDLLLLEVGLGGAIDSTNVITPVVSVLTNIAMDHMDYLGNTIQEITAVKTGIIKSGIPVVTSAKNPEALKIIEAACREKAAQLTVVGNQVTVEQKEFSTAGQKFSIFTDSNHYEDLTLPLLGRHQITNAAGVVAVIEVLQQLGYTIPKEAVHSGLAKTDWPARLEIMRQKPTVLIDAAHNLDGVQSLKQALLDYFPSKKVTLVLGMLGDKERSKVVAELTPLAEAVVITKPNSPRAGDWELLADEARRFTDKVTLIENITEAVDAAMSMAGEEDLVCITGSFYMVAEAREHVMH